MKNFIRHCEEPVRSDKDYCIPTKQSVGDNDFHCQRIASSGNITHNKKILAPRNDGNFLATIIISSLLVIFSSCDIKENKKETDPKISFIKIFENNNFTTAFHPIDVQACNDGGYIVLAKRRIPASSFFGVYVLKTDELGTPVHEETLADDIVNPVYNLMKVGNTFYFFAMNNITLETRLMSISQGGNVSEITTIAEVIYPLYASLDEGSGQFLLQHYNRDDKQTMMSMINTAGAVTAQREFEIGFGDFDVEEPIVDHMTGNDKELPFLAGSLGNGTYFFNGFYNYTLSTVFFSFNTANPGLLQGYKDERCVSAMQFSDGNTFAMSRYAYGDNYISPQTTINYSSGAIASSSDINGNLMLEFSPDARVVLKKIEVNGNDILVYNSDTKSKQICLYFYDENSGDLLGTKYIGYSNPYEVGNFVSTPDGGMIVVGTTYLAGRFPRIVLVKLSKEELEEAVN